MTTIKKQINCYAVITFVSIILSLDSFAVTKTWYGGENVWDSATSWSPTNAPTSSDDAIVTSGQAVVLHVDGECKSLDVSGSGFATVNHADRKLTVSDDAIVSDSGAQLRVNLGLFDVGGTATATNSGKIVIDLSNAVFKAASISLETGILEWNSGTLWLTDDLYIETGAALQSRTIIENQTLLSSNASSGVALWLQDSGILTLDGGKIICNNFFKTAAATLNLYDGELIVDADGGANFEWGHFPLVLNGSSGKNPHLILDGLYFPSAYADVLLATGEYSRASLTITDLTRLGGNATVAGGQGSIADVIVSESAEWSATNLVIGSYGFASLTITNNSRLDECRDFHIAQHAGSTGIVTITKNSSWDSYWKSYIAERGLAIISVSDNSYMKLDAQSQNAVFGKYSGSEARITISDPGSSFEILRDANYHTFIFGESGSALLIISNGAHATFNDFTQFGDNTSGRGNVVVTGNGSKFHVDSDVWFGYEGMATMQVLDGATCLWDETKLGEFPRGVGEVRVSGAGSYWNGGGYSSIGGEFLVGRYGKGTVLVENGATMHSSGYSKIGEYDESIGSVTVTGTGSLWHASGDLKIGTTYNNHATGIVTIAHGGRVIVNSGVTIGYSSILTGNGGTLHADVDNIHGEIDPGSSIGTIVIDGDFSQQSGGAIDLELAGTLLNEHDRLVVTGSSTLAGSLIVTLDNHTPSNGFVYQVFEWVGGTSGSFDDVQLPGLSTGLEWSTNLLYINGTLHVIPEPGFVFVILNSVFVIFWRKIVSKR